jgi:hypothetical protein
MANMPEARLQGYEKVCQCGIGFVTSNVRRIHCDGCRKTKTGGNKARAVSRKTNDIEFVGVDGEGVDRPNGRHEYVMLSVGERTLWKDGRELTLREILSFLWECYCQNPQAAYVGFFLGYDFIQWEKLLPESVAHSLLTNAGIAARKSQVSGRANPYPDAVVWEGWEIDIMAGRRFKLRPHICHRSAYNSLCRNRTCGKALDDVVEHPEILPGEMEFRIPDNTGIDYDGSVSDFWKTFFPVSHKAGVNGVQARVSGWLYICDTGPFWQTSFLKVINPKGWDDPVCTQAEYDKVEKGKGDRGITVPYGENWYYQEMMEYNILENDILSRVTRRLNEGFMNDQIPIALKRAEWYGPGRAAQTWIDMLHDRITDEEARRHNKDMGIRFSTGDPLRRNEGGLLNADVYMSMPTWFYDAALASYYGGWFEQMVHGHCGNVWEYDINSAYPYIIASLPCLHSHGTHNGSYSRGTGPYVETDDKSYTLLYGHFKGSNPYIGALPYRSKDGRILRPLETQGWYWKHEVDSAIRAGLVDTVEVSEWVTYHPCTCTPPFDPSDIGISRMYMLRLEAGKNSPQGKALKLVYNSAYGKTAQSIGSPKYSNPVYASLITAGCRTLILDAIASHPDGAASVSMVATDGVYFLTRHPSLNLSPTELGAWDETFKPGMTQLMPGVYWDDKTREKIKDGLAPSLKSRGVNARDLAQQIAKLDAEFANSHVRLAMGDDFDWPTIQFNVAFLLDSAKLALQRGKWNTAGRVQHGTTRKISANPISKRIPTAYRDDDSWGGITRTRPYERGTCLDTTPYKKTFGYVSEADLQIDRDGGDGLQYFRDLLRDN